MCKKVDENMSDEIECVECGDKFTETDDPNYEYCSGCYANVCELCGCVSTDPNHVYTVDDCQECGAKIAPEETCDGEVITILCDECANK